MKNLSYIKIFWFFILILFTSFSNLLSQRRDVESDIRYKQASAYYRSGSYERAIPLFNKALKENPHHRGAFEKLIQVYLRIRKADSIEVLTTRFSENNKLRFSDYMAVAASKIIKGNKKEALRFIDKHIEERRQNKKLKPNDIQNAAFMLQRYRMTDEALSYFETGIKYFPKASYFYTSMADIYKQQMKYSAATGAYLQFLVSKPDGLKTVSSRIMSMKTSSEQKEEIGKTIQSFIKKYSDNKNLVQLYIEFKIRNQDYNSAIQLVEKSIPKDERLPHIIKIAGEMGSNSEALEAIELLEKYNIKLKDKDNYRLNLQLIELYAVEFKESHTTDWLEKIDLLLKKLNKLNE
ncbi:MAG: tetratricopeptide repeat protein, partial [Calditrichia bacterium]|nr:tetratricopeptide repeat protein [Calditrichia bacterium]